MWVSSSTKRHAPMGMKLEYAQQYGLRGMEFWTLDQMKNASGEYPNLAAIRP